MIDPSHTQALTDLRPFILHLLRPLPASLRDDAAQDITLELWTRALPGYDARRGAIDHYLKGCAVRRLTAEHEPQPDATHELEHLRTITSRIRVYGNQDRLLEQLLAHPGEQIKRIAPPPLGAATRAARAEPSPASEHASGPPGANHATRPGERPAT